MTIPESSKYLIEQGPVNYSDPLAEYYSKRAQQMEQHLQDSIAARNQKAKIAADESFVNVLKGVAQFSQAARSAVDAHKARKEKKDTKDRQDLANTLSRNPFYQEHGHTLIEHGHLASEAEQKGWKLDYDKASAALIKNPDHKRLVELSIAYREFGDQAAAEEVLNASGRRLRLQNEILVQNAGTALSETQMLKDWNRTKQVDKETAWAAAEKNPHKRKALFIEWQNEQIAHLNLKPETVGALLGKEFNRQRSTVGNLQKARVSASIAKEQDLRINTALTTANASGNLAKGIWEVREDLLETGQFKSIEGGPTANQQVDAYLNDVLGRLALDGDINTSQLEPYINLGITHPAGKTVGTTILSKEQVADLVTKAQIGEGRRLSVLTSRDISGLEEARQLKIKGDEESDAKADEILAGLSVRGLVPKEQIEAVSNMSMADNTPQAYEREKEEWEIELENGNIVAAETAAKDIKNDKLRKEVLAKIALHKKVRKRVNYSERWLDIKVSEGMDLTLKEDDPLNQRGIKVRNDLLNYLRKDFQRRIEADPDNPNAFNESIQAVETYWIANGGKNKGQKNEIRGKFTVDSNGRYDAYDEYTNTLSARRQNTLLRSTKVQVATWDKEMNDAWKTAASKPSGGQTTLEKMVNTPGVLSIDDVIGCYENGILSQEVITKARRAGIQPTTLLRGQFIAWQNTDQGSRLNAIGQSNIDNFPNNDELMADAIKRSGNGDLIYLMQKVGPENWSPQQFQRIRDELAKDAEFQANIKTRTEEGINQIEQERRPETYTGPTY